MTEQEIINAIYYLVEIDSEPWASSDDEYLTARGLSNIAINRWEKYENTVWEDLIANLTDSNVLLLGDKSTTANIYSYNCPTDFVRPVSFVTIGGELFDVKKATELQSLKDSTARWVYFTGNIKDGYKLNINRNLEVVGGDTIEYEYYKKPTSFTTTSSETEMSDPYFIVYFVAAHMGDDGINGDYYQMAEARLEQMRTVNISGLWGVSNNVETTMDSLDGFGR